ncbi:uncharacterized protein [Miscanthus floridulus]|uniref:uncharacterized protein n=1 Tax=Miscanthus floridulus TaxID=154761 RepID=UPI003458D7C8
MSSSTGRMKFHQFTETTFTVVARILPPRSWRPPLLVHCHGRQPSYDAGGCGGPFPPSVPLPQIRFSSYEQVSHSTSPSSSGTVAGPNSGPPTYGARWNRGRRVPVLAGLLPRLGFWHRWMMVNRPYCYAVNPTALL